MSGDIIRNANNKNSQNSDLKHINKNKKQNYGIQEEQNRLNTNTKNSISAFEKTQKYRNCKCL